MKRVICKVLLTLLCLLICGSSGAQNGKKINSSGTKVTETRKTEAFRGISTCPGVSVRLSRGTEHNVEVQTDKNLIGHILTSVENGVLNIRYNERININNINTTVYVTAPEITVLVTDSGSNIKSSGTFSSDKIEIRADAGSSIAGAFDCRVMNIKQDSGTSVTLSGSAVNCTLHIDSGSAARLSELKCENVSVSTDSACTVEVYATKSLTASVGAVSTLRYRGEPEKMNITEEEFSRVKKM